MLQSKYRCRQCGHGFSLLPGVLEEEARCPRCDSGSLEGSAFLLGTESVDDLLPEDYFEVALAPCCTLGFRGWHQSRAGEAASPASADGDLEEGGLMHGAQG